MVRTACCARSDSAVQLMSRPSRWRSDAKATLLAVSSARTVFRVSSVCSCQIRKAISETFKRLQNQTVENSS